MDGVKTCRVDATLDEYFDYNACDYGAGDPMTPLFSRNVRGNENTGGGPLPDWLASRDVLGALMAHVTAEPRVRNSTSTCWIKRSLLDH